MKSGNITIFKTVVIRHLGSSKFEIFHIQLLLFSVINNYCYYLYTKLRENQKIHCRVMENSDVFQYGINPTF